MITDADILGSTRQGMYEVVLFGEKKIAEKHTHPDIVDALWLIDGEFWPGELLDKQKEI